MTDRNGPWLSDRLRELGVDLAYTVVVGRPARRTSPRRCVPGRARASTSSLTSGGLGPTADDLTAEVVGRLPGPRDGASTRRSRPGSGAILEPLRARWPRPRPGRGARGEPQAGASCRRARRSSSRSAPRPASSCRPPRAATARPSSCSRGRRASCSRCGPPPRRTDGLRAPRSPARRPTASETLRLFGIPESEIAETLRVRRAARASTSTRSRSRPACGAARSRSSRATSRRPRPPTTRFEAVVRERHADTLFSDGRLDRRRAGRRGCCATAAGRSRPPSRAPAACSAGRLTELRGLLGLRPRRPRRLRRRGQGRARRRRPGAASRAHGAVSTEVAEALADGARARARRRRRRRDHRHRRARAAARRTSRWGSSASRSQHGRRATA